MSSNTKRNELYRILPLRTPLSLHIFPSYYCNFRCNYCLHSLSGEELQRKGFQRQLMEMDVFRRAVDCACAFDDPIKALIFAGHGEPLLHRDIADMVAYAKKSARFGRVEIVTNGSLLTHELSDRLIDAGLDRLRISLQGLCAEDYRKVSDVAIDFSRFYEQLEYFYRHKTDTEVYIKIIDIALKGDAGEKHFFELFRPVADVVAVEYAIPFVNEIDYSKVATLSERSKQGNMRRSRLCSMPFYMLVVLPNGSVAPCCATEVPVVFGNIQTESLRDCWNSECREQFLAAMLHGAAGIPVCADCSVPSYGLQDGDYLDGHEQEILSKLERYDESDY